MVSSLGVSLLFPELATSFANDVACRRANRFINRESAVVVGTSQ